MRSQRAFTRVELVVILAVVALFTLLLIPALFREKRRQVQIQCASNLQITGTGFRYWADRGNRYPMLTSVESGGARELMRKGEMFRAFQCLSNDMPSPLFLTCPADTRIPATNFASLQNSNISYFVGLDADESNPRVFMTGDRNWIINGQSASPGLALVMTNDTASWSPAIHHGHGNVVMADGSVQKFTSAQLQTALQQTANATNRLAFP